MIPQVHIPHIQQTHIHTGLKAEDSLECAIKVSSFFILTAAAATRQDLSLSLREIKRNMQS